jgi:hypothetical protein
MPPTYTFCTQASEVTGVFLQTYNDKKTSDVDANPHGPALVRLSWIRILIGIGNADPEQEAWKLNKIKK